MITKEPSTKRRRIRAFPATRLGRWAVWCGAASIALTLAWSVLPLGAWSGFAIGLAGGALALVATIRDGERALSVFAVVLLALLILGFIVVEILSLMGVLPEH